MREIKFRAWFPAPYFSEPHMAYSPTDDSDYFGGRSSIWDLLEIYESSQTPESPIYMQYTGLRDKNGREIYEGDIVRWQHGDGTGIRNLGTGVSKVIFERGSFCFPDYMPLEYFMEDASESYMEVIGNIYEAPELLAFKEEEEEEEELDVDDLRLESIRADVEAEQAYDLDEGVVITTTKTLNMPIYYEDDEVIIQ